MGRTSPIDMLPPEILLLVFEQPVLTPLEPYESVDTPLLASLFVCRKWRDLATSVLCDSFETAPQMMDEKQRETALEKAEKLGPETVVTIRRTFATLEKAERTFVSNHHPLLLISLSKGLVGQAERSKPKWRFVPGDGWTRSPPDFPSAMFQSKINVVKKVIEIVPTMKIYTQARDCLCRLFWATTRFKEVGPAGSAYFERINRVQTAIRDVILDIQRELPMGVLRNGGRPSFYSLLMMTDG